MAFSRSSILAARLIVLERAGSTNDELTSRLGSGSRSDWPEFSVLVTDTQTSGRGRLGRSWVAPARTMLAISMVLRPATRGISRAESLGWIPLLAGLAMTRALDELGVTAELKWPNDVLIDGRKVCGILAEALADGTVVLGAGVNLTVQRDELPVQNATSMLIEGGEADGDAVLAGYLAELRALYERLVLSHGDAESCGLRREVVAACATIGKAVRIKLPAARDLVGVAKDLDEDGRLVVDADGQRTAVAAGDVTHLRY